MKKILGIDTGTNSLGWAIVDRKGDDRWLLDKGVNIFQEGVSGHALVQGCDFEISELGEIKWLRKHD